MDANLVYGEKAWQQMHMNATGYIEQIQAAAFRKRAAIRPHTTHLKNHSN